MSRRSTWSFEEDRKLVDLRAAGVHPDKIGPKLARTASSCKTRLQWHGATTIKDAQKVASENRYGQRFGKDIGHKVKISPSVCPSIIAAQEVNLDAYELRNLTARQFGDPPPGRSALDLKQQQQQQPRITLPRIAAMVLR